MAKSARYRQLVRRLDELRDHLLPTPFSPIGEYPVRQNDLSKAYVVLAHAELEAYFEDRAREKAEKALKRWQSKKHHTGVLNRLLAHFQSKQKPPWRPPEKTEDVINRSTKSYFAGIDTNHGIREPHLYKLLSPIGLTYNDLDVVWLATIDSFSKSRGELAHTGFKMHQRIDPEVEWKRITDQILPGIEMLDNKLARLR